MGDLEKMKAGLWLHAICPEIGGALLRTEELVFRLNQLPPSRREEREAIIRQLFGHVGKSVCIHSPFHCDFGAQISVGDHFVGNFNLTILDEAPVTIGDHVFIGPNVGIYTVNHALLPDQRNAGIMRSLPIAIGNNVWIGGHTVVMQGDDRRQHGDRGRERRHARHPGGSRGRRLALPRPAEDHRGGSGNARMKKKKRSDPGRFYVIARSAATRQSDCCAVALRPRSRIRRTRPISPSTMNFESLLTRFSVSGSNS